MLSATFRPPKTTAGPRSLPVPGTLTWLTVVPLTRNTVRESGWVTGMTPSAWSGMSTGPRIGDWTTEAILLSVRVEI